LRFVFVGTAYVQNDLIEGVCKKEMHKEFTAQGGSKVEGTAACGGWNGAASLDRSPAATLAHAFCPDRLPFSVENPQLAVHAVHESRIGGAANGSLVDGKDF
jgi:hypothetical protein